MHGFYTEYRELPPGTKLSHDLAQHIYLRSAKGSVIVVTDRPHDLAAITKKQWNILIRLVQRERSSTLKAARIAELSNQIGWMQDMKFIINLQKDPKEHSIIFAALEQLKVTPPACSAMYITITLDGDALNTIVRNMREPSILIRYN